MVKRRNVFVPHPWNRYKYSHDKIIEKLKSIPYLGKKIANYSAPPYKPVPAKTELGAKRLITRKIRTANFVVVDATKAIYYHPFTLWELKKAKELGKLIIVIKKKGQIVPRILRRFTDYIITRKDKLKKIIKQL